MFTTLDCKTESQYAIELLIHIFGFVTAEIAPIPPRQPQCYSNSDCSSDRQCINSLCLNPCIAANVCGINTLCHVDKHYPVCRCPDNYLGDPMTECIPRKLTISFYLFHTKSNLNLWQMFKEWF